MKKKHFRILSIAIVLVMALGLLAACADDPPAATNGGVTPGDGDIEIVIGLTGPLSGPHAQFGINIEHGVMLFVEEFNARNNGIYINLISYDDEGDPIMGVTNFERFLDYNVTAVIGSATSGVTMAIVPRAFEYNMPMITATSTNRYVTIDRNTGDVFTNMFRACFIDPFQGYAMANFAVDYLGAQTFALLYNNTIDYSIGLMEAFRDQMIARGATGVATEVFASGAVDFRAQLTNIAAANPDVVFMPEYYESTALAGPQSVEAGLDAILLGGDGWDGTVDIMPDASSLEGSFFLTGFTAETDDPMILNFVERFNARVGMDPNKFGALGYDAALIMISAIERTLAATDHAPDSEAFRLAVIAQLAATDVVGVTGRTVYDQFNNPQKSAIVKVIRDGEARLHDIIDP